MKSRARLNYTNNVNTHILTLRSRKRRAWTRERKEEHRKKCLSISSWWHVRMHGCISFDASGRVCVCLCPFFCHCCVFFQIFFLISVLIPPQKQMIDHIPRTIRNNVEWQWQKEREHHQLQHQYKSSNSLHFQQKCLPHLFKSFAYHIVLQPVTSYMLIYTYVYRYIDVDTYIYIVHSHTHSNAVLSCGFHSYTLYSDAKLLTYIFHVYVFAYLAYIRHLNSNTDILFEYLHLLIDFGIKAKKSICFPFSFTHSDQYLFFNCSKFTKISVTFNWQRFTTISVQFKKDCSKVEFF